MGSFLHKSADSGKFFLICSPVHHMTVSFYKFISLQELTHLLIACSIFNVRLRLSILYKLGPSLPASEEGEEVVDGDTNEDEEDGDEEEEEEEENEEEICADSGEEEQEVQGRGEAEEDTSEPEASEEDSSLRGIDLTIHPPLPLKKTCYIIMIFFLAETEYKFMKVNMIFGVE